MILSTPRPDIKPRDTLYTKTHEIVKATGVVVHLTNQEGVILAAIHSALPVSMNRWDIAKMLWGPRENWPGDWENTLRQHVFNLRKKINRCTFSIMTHWGGGYRLDGELEVK
jgi:DNA-binding response OmpR family regulator